MRKPREIIAFDIDDVLFYGTEPLAEIYAEVHGAAVEYPSLDSSGALRGLFHIFRDITPEYTQEEIVDKVEEILVSPRYHALGPLPGAVRSVARITEKRPAVAVSNRPQVLKAATQMAINRHFPDMFQSIHILGDKWGQGTSIDKNAMLRELGVTVIIDDLPFHAERAREVDARAILFGNYSWNRVGQVADHVTRCENWVAVDEYFDARR